MRSDDLEMITIGEGYFLMGADEGKEEDSEYEEQPERKVWLSSYQIQKTPVSVAQWRQFLRESEYHWDFPEHLSRGSLMFENHPITCVSWYDAWQFVLWLRERCDSRYSLPTEAQWEKACRGTNGQLYPWHQQLDWSNEVVNYNEQYLKYKEVSLPIGLRPELKSPYGCLDMWQNVSEWCMDWFDDGDYFHDPDVSWCDPSGVSFGYVKVCRGGNPLTSGWPRCTRRLEVLPDIHHSNIGFRLVLNSKENSYGHGG